MLFHSVACVAFMWSLVTFGEAFDETKRRRKERKGEEREGSQSKGHASDVATNCANTVGNYGKLYDKS